MKQWTEKTAVITGAASGIGAGLARHCASLGMHTVAVDVDQAGLADLAAAPGIGAAASFVSCNVDVRDEDAVNALARDVYARCGEVNLLFNNAGVLVDGKSWERTVDEWRWSIDVNIMGVVHGLRAFVPRMLQQGSAARVINTSSIGGLLGGGGFLAPYQGTKHMITAITESLYQELLMEQAPVTASVLCPAEVSTAIWSSDRLRPELGHRAPGSEAEARFRELVAGGVAEGTDPDDFAQQVFRGIEADRFWLLPQPEFKAQLSDRHTSILDERNPASIAEMLGYQ